MQGDQKFDGVEPLPAYSSTSDSEQQHNVQDLKASQLALVESLNTTASTTPPSSAATLPSKSYAIFNSKSFRTFALWEFKSLSDFAIHAGTTLEDPCIYYIQNSVFTTKTPDDQVHAGNDEDGPILASAKFYNLKGDVTLAVGKGSDRNCHGSSSIPGFKPPVYEEMRKVSFVAHSKYQFSTDLTRDGTRRKYVWKRSTYAGKNLCWDHRCFEEESGELVARFENAGIKWEESGDSRFLKSEGEKWELLILVAFLSVREKENRLAAYSKGVCIG